MNWEKNWLWITVVLALGVLGWWLYRGGYLASVVASAKGLFAHSSGDATGPTTNGSRAGCGDVPASAGTDGTFIGPPAPCGGDE